MPALLFSKIVPSFTSDNLGAIGEVFIEHGYFLTAYLVLPIGPLLLVGILYKLLGFLVAWVVSQFFWVPHRFRYGILVAGGWGNWGDLRKSFLSCVHLRGSLANQIYDTATSVVMGITSAAPFAGSKDGDLGVAYIAILILVFFVSNYSIGPK